MQDPIIDPFDPNFTKKQQAAAQNAQTLTKYASDLAAFNIQVAAWLGNAQNFYDHGQAIPEAPKPPVRLIYSFNEATGQIEEAKWADSSLKAPTFTPTQPNGTSTIKAQPTSADPAELRHQQMLAALKVISDKLDKLLAGGK